MRSLQLNEIAYQLGIRVYCNVCKSTFDPRKLDLKNTNPSCKHPARKQRYKSIICVGSINIQRKRMTLNHETRQLTEVIEKGIEFKKHVKSLVQENVTVKIEKPILLINCLMTFLKFKMNDGVKEHQIKTLSKNSLNAFENHIKKWKEATVLAGEDFFEISVYEVSDNNVSHTIKHLSKWSTSVQKKAFGFFNQFYSFLNDNGYDVVSPFYGIEVMDVPTREARAVTYDEFKVIRNSMVNGSSDDKINGKIRYFEWLPEALDFAALTGRRREEFMFAKFSDIELIDGQLLGGYIKMIDSKFSRQSAHKVAFQNRYTKAPIFPELYDFLIKMGFEEFKDSDRYIVAGENKSQRDTLANNLTNAFSFYREKVNISPLVQLKGLRKKYITRMRNEFGDNANFFTGHKESRIDKKHYYDDSEIFEKVKSFVLWK